MKKYIAFAFAVMMLVCCFTACSKKYDGADTVTAEDGGTMAVVTGEDGDVARNEDGDVVVIATDKNGDVKKDKDGNNVTEKADLQTALVYNNRIEFNDYYLVIPDGWENNMSYQDLQIKNEKTGDSISIMRVDNATYEEKVQQVKNAYDYIIEKYPDTETGEKGVEIDGQNCTLYYAFVPETTNKKPLYQGYVIMERSDAIYNFYISSQRDVRKDMDKITEILNSVEFK